MELYDKISYRRHSILTIVDELRDDLEYLDPLQSSLTAILQVIIVALWMYATGCLQNLVVETIRIDQSTTSQTIHRMINALVGRMHEWVQLPTQQ